MSLRALALLALLALAACSTEGGQDASFTPRLNGSYRAYGVVTTH